MGMSIQDSCNARISPGRDFDRPLHPVIVHQSGFTEISTTSRSGLSNACARGIDDGRRQETQSGALAWLLDQPSMVEETAALPFCATERPELLDV
jgi:hypothetical protein